MTDKKDPPIEEQNFLYGATVVNFGDVRVARGLSRRPFSSCNHTQLVFDSKERRVWCKDCETNIDNFEAFSLLVDNMHFAMARLEEVRKEAEDAHNREIHLIACKNIEKAWRGRTMAISCPHCRGGLLPDDFSKGIKSMQSAELERQRRKAQNEKNNK